MINKIASPASTVKERIVPAEFREVAEGMESQFARHLIDEMRKSVPENDDESSSTEFYDSLLDEEYAQLLAKSSPGLGIKKLILDQLYPQQNLNSSIRMQAQTEKQGAKND